MKYFQVYFKNPVQGHFRCTLKIFTHGVLCIYSIAQVIAVLITALRQMRRRLLQQDRGNTAEADHTQIVNTNLITEAELTHAPGSNCKMSRVTILLLISWTASSVWMLCVIVVTFFSLVDLQYSMFPYILFNKPFFTHVINTDTRQYNLMRMVIFVVH
jgi:hypothetical protein